MMDSKDFITRVIAAEELKNSEKLEAMKFSDFSYFCYGGARTEALNIIDTSNGTNFGSMFYNCSSLTNLTLYNIRKSITIGSGTSWGHLLTVDSLVHTIQELCAASSSQTLTMGSANLNKIANIYCKVIDGSNEKKPMELCESTDEGAMTLTAYANMKNWNLA